MAAQHSPTSAFALAGGVPPSEPVPPVPGQTPDRDPVVPDPLEPIIDPDDGVVAPVRLPGHEDKPARERVASGVRP